MIAVATFDLAQNAVGTQQRQPTTDACSAATLLLVGGRSWKQDAPEVAIAQAANGELAAVYGLEQGPIGRRPGIERAITSALLPDGTAELFSQLTQGRVFIDRGQCHQIPLVGSFGHFGPPPQAAQTPPHPPPFLS